MGECFFKRAEVKRCGFRGNLSGGLRFIYTMVPRDFLVAYRLLMSSAAVRKYSELKELVVESNFLDRQLFGRKISIERIDNNYDNFKTNTLRGRHDISN